MKFSRLFKESQLFWPAEIPIDDGYFQGDDGGFFPTLSAVWDKSEKLQSQINEWHGLMSWAIFCGLHKAACEHLKNGDLSPVRLVEIDRVYVESKISEAFKSVYPSWSKQMKTQYVNDVKT